MDNTNMNQPVQEGGNSIGPVIGIIIILIVIIIGGLYFWVRRTNSTQTSTPVTTDSSIQNTVNDIENTSSSDEVSAIQTDLMQTRTADLDSQLYVNQ